VVEPKHDCRGYFHRNRGPAEQWNGSERLARRKQCRQIKVDTDHDEKDRNQKSKTDRFEVSEQFAI
jgi:hypothetical protein